MRPNKKAVSPVVGMVLVLGIVAGFMAIIQSSYIPVWDKQAETASFNNLVYEVSKLPLILTSGTSSTSITLKVGTKYPTYPLLVNPTSVAGSVYFKPEKVVINGTIVSTNQRYYNVTYTSAIIIKPGRLFNRDVKLVYEYGAILENGSGYSNIVKVVNQTAFSKYSIVLPIVNSSQSTNVSGVIIPLHLYLVSRGTGIPLENLSITFNTTMPNYWYNLLVGIYGINHVKKIGTNAVEVYNISAMLSLPYWSISAGYTLSQKPLVRVVRRIIPLNNPVNVGVGSTSPFQVLVVDQFGNPVAGAIVNATVLQSYVGYVSVTPKSTVTNIQGVATFYVYGIKPTQTAEINVSAKGSGSIIGQTTNMTIDVNITAPTVTTTPVLSQIKFIGGNVTVGSLYYFAGAGNLVYNGTLNATVQALDSSGNPIKNVTITFNFESQIKSGLYISMATFTSVTNSSGYAVLKDVPVTFYAYRRAGYDSVYLELIASNGSISTTATGSYVNASFPSAGTVITLT